MKSQENSQNYRRSRCDIVQNSDQIIMRLEMPGVGKSGLDINVEGDKLSIIGRRIQESLKGDKLIHEIRPGDYKMEYTIDETIDRNAIDASLEKGVLTLTLGLSEAVKPRKIEVVGK